MPKATSPSFITEIPLKAGSHELCILGKRFFAAKQQYNALLGEALGRLRKMREDTRYDKARDSTRKKEKKQRPKPFSSN